MEFEILDENSKEGADSQKRMLSEEDEHFFDSHSKKSRECYDLKRSISDDSDTILGNNIIIKSVVKKNQNVNENLMNSVNKGRSLQKSTDPSEKMTDLQSNHRDKGNKDYRLAIVRSKDDKNVFKNPSRNLNMIQNSIFKDHIINDAVRI